MGNVNLGKLLNALVPLGITIDGYSPVAINVARELKIRAFLSGTSPVFLRILDKEKGERDFSSLSFLQSRLGNHVNAPSSLVTSEDLVCVFFPFVRHEKVSRRMFASEGLLPQVLDVLASMHVAGGEFTTQGRSLSIAEVVEIVEGVDGSNPSVAQYIERTLQHIRDERGPVAQHCDFTYANLGISDDGVLIVFDWEDYGLVRYPGFDVSTFLLSHYHHSGAIDEIVQSPESLATRMNADIGASFVGKLGITVTDLVRFFPAYLCVFMTLKRGFGAPIYERIRATWLRTLRSEGWMRMICSRRV